jgi:methyltransferase-like protein 6
MIKSQKMLRLTMTESKPVMKATLYPVLGGRAASQRSRGYVGDRTPGAGEYHDSDFDWGTCVGEGEAALKRQRNEFAAVSISSTNTLQGKLVGEDGADDHGDPAWDTFHQRHSAARFFKEKRYLPLEFPVLLSQNSRPGGPALHVAEVGCGCGSALLPVLKANPSAIATAVDVSPTAIRLFLEAATRCGIDNDRIRAFVLDASTQTTALTDLEADCALCIFALSALMPCDMTSMLQHCRDALRTGGLLLFRDYGRYDMAQLRFSGDQLVDSDALVYRRQDGTLASFFTVEEIVSLANKVGFEVKECRYATTIMRNRRDGKEMKRVFVHGVFEKP